MCIHIPVQPFILPSSPFFLCPRSFLPLTPQQSTSSVSFADSAHRRSWPERVLTFTVMFHILQILSPFSLVSKQESKLLFFVELVLVKCETLLTEPCRVFKIILSGWPTIKRGIRQKTQKSDPVFA